MRKQLLLTSVLSSVLCMAYGQSYTHMTKTGAIIKASIPSSIIESTLPLDAQVVKQNAPMFVQRNTPVKISGVVHNYGLNTITSMRVNYSINGGPTVSEVQSSLNINSKSDYSFTHGATWVPGHNGYYTITIWVDQLNGVNISTSDMLTYRPEAIDSVATKMPLYEEFKQASCDPCYLACPNMDSVFVKNKNRCNLIEYHADWPGVDYMDDVTDIPFVTDRVNFYGVENYGVPDGQMDGTTTTDNIDPSTISTSNIVSEASLGSPFTISATATYTAATNTYAVKAEVHSYIGTKATMKLKLRCVLTLDSIKYPYDQSDEDPLSAFAPPLGTTAGGDPDNTFKYVTNFPQVAEDMLPDTAGTVITPFAAHGSQTFSLSWKKNHPWGFCPHSGCVDNATGGGGTTGSGSLVPSTYDSVGNLVHLTLYVQSDSSLYVYQSLSIAPTVPTGIDEVVGDLNSLNVYPNPSNGMVNVAFNLQETENVTVEVYNIVGQQVYTNTMAKAVSGNHVVTFDGKGFAPGVYLVRCIAGSNIATKRLVIE